MGNTGFRGNSADDDIVERCFATSYVDARAQFRAAAQQAPGATLHVLEPFPGYYIDIAVVNSSTEASAARSDSNALVIHSSGVHGVEGYAGSAIQTHYLLSYGKSGTAAAMEPDNGPETTIILIHAYNPFGMAHDRRVNEHNVDLNRNALTKSQWQALSSHYNRDNYVRFDAFFNPKFAPTVWYAYVGIWWTAGRLLWQHGLATLKAALVGGQYHDARGISYGGNNWVEPSSQLVQDWLARYVAGRKNAFAAVTWIDVHTGLGPRGVDTMMGMAAKGGGNDGERAVATEIDQWFPDSLNPAHSRAAQKVAAGYENVQGLVVHYMTKRLFDSSSGHRHVLGLVQEFGTLPSILVGRALILENAAYQYGAAPRRHCQWTASTTRPAFYPASSRKWKQSVLERGQRVLQQAIVRSRELAMKSK